MEKLTFLILFLMVTLGGCSNSSQSPNVLLYKKDVKILSSGNIKGHFEFSPESCGVFTPCFVYKMKKGGMKKLPVVIISEKEISAGTIFSFTVEIPEGYCLAVLPKKGVRVKKQYFPTLFLPEVEFRGECIPWAATKEVTTDIMVISDKKRGENLFEIAFVKV